MEGKGGKRPFRFLMSIILLDFETKISLPYEVRS